jgi:hypothetical protein
MKNKLLTLAAALALLAVLGHFYAKPLLAQVRAALVKNLDEPGRNPYAQNVRGDSTAGGCQSATITVPANRRLVIENVTFEASGSSDVSFELETNVLDTTLGFNRRIFLPASQAGSGIFIVNDPVLAYLEPGTTFVMNGVTNLGCHFNGTVFGHLIDLTQ